jgi:uncharacterized membrane protein
MKIHKSLTILAPVETIFAYLDDPTHLPLIWDNLKAVTDVEVLPNGGKKFRWTYHMLGQDFEGESVTTVYEPNQMITGVSEEAIRSSFTWRFEPITVNSTDVTLEVDYDVPLPIIGKIVEAVLVSSNQDEAEKILAQLKAQVETV